jgi:hypothetical protein
MKIELKNIKLHLSMSQETFCFEASMYVDGKKVSRVSNRGQGGEHDYDAPLRTIDPIDDWCKANLPKWGSQFGEGDNHETDLSMHISDLVNQYSILKEYKKLLRNKLVFLPKHLKGDSYQTMPKPKFGNNESLNRWIGRVGAKHPEHYVLNALPTDEAQKLWMKFNTNTQLY